MTKEKTNHAAFLELMGPLKFRRQCGHAIIITDEEADLILAEGEWVKEFINARKNAALKIVNPGPKPKPNNEIKPESLARRLKRQEARKPKS